MAIKKTIILDVDAGQGISEVKQLNTEVNILATAFIKQLSQEV